jgi:hypothetical protein
MDFPHIANHELSGEATVSRTVRHYGELPVFRILKYAV